MEKLNRIQIKGQTETFKSLQNESADRGAEPGRAVSTSSSRLISCNGHADRERAHRDDQSDQRQTGRQTDSRKSRLTGEISGGSGWGEGGEAGFSCPG